MPDTSPHRDTPRRRAGWGGARSAGESGRVPGVWGPAVAVVVAAAVYALLPDTLLLLPRVAIPVLELALLGALLATHQRGMHQWSRRTSIALSVLIIVANLASLTRLVLAISTPAPGSTMLLGAMQVWITGIIGFALLYWEIDRGGPAARRELPRERLPLADWRFSQDENDDAVGEIAEGSSERGGWLPHFADYVYLSITNSSAFSPTDTMPLSTRAKALMSLQSTAALLTSLLIVARAVGSMSGSGG